jgi:anti-anti-sigma factor
MKYKLEKVNDVQVIELQGSLEGGWETFQLKDEIASQLEKGERKFLVDMHKANFVNSTGIGVMVAIQITARNADGVVRFCCIGDRVGRSFKATGAGIWDNMEIFDNRGEALRSFAAD